MLGRKYPNKYIPRKMFQDGIDLCKRNINDFLSEAELILSKGNLNHAYILIQFAIEEFGKIIMIKEAFETDTNDPCKVDGAVFGTHIGKSKKAWTVLNPKYKLLFDEGVCFPNTLFERGVAVENTEASHYTRIMCAFVDFFSSQWLIGCEFKKKYLENLIRHIKEKMLVI